MNYISAYCTDAGAIKRINQDSLCIKSAASGKNEYILAAVCDGLGGLSDGETASAFVICRLSDWFEESLPELIKQEKTVLQIRKALDEALHDANDRLNAYSEKSRKLLGTTMSLLLYLGNHQKIITAHAGDTRIYQITDSRTDILTTDHSVLADEIKNGNISEEEALNDRRQNQLTRCMGAQLENTAFDYSIIPAETEVTYMICSDGFRKKITAEDISEKLRPGLISDEAAGEKSLRALTDMCIAAKETDNITSLIVKLTEKADL